MNADRRSFERKKKSGRLFDHFDGIVHGLALKTTPARDEAAVIVELKKEVEALGVNVSRA